MAAAVRGIQEEVGSAGSPTAEEQVGLEAPATSLLSDVALETAVQNVVAQAVSDPPFLYVFILTGLVVFLRHPPFLRCILII